MGKFRKQYPPTTSDIWKDCPLPLGVNRNVKVQEELPICKYAKDDVEATDPTQQDIIECRRAQAANDAR